MSDKLPTLYEYYTLPKIEIGLSFDETQFKLNNRSITIYSGALHYFRVPPSYWRDRLRKCRAAGLNAVETYIPWNLHEPQPNRFNFTDHLDVVKFLQIAYEEDLLVILRPGPYICAEWDFGGLPSWLLREKDLRIRTSDPRFLDLVKRYFTKLLAVLAPFQFTRGGPVIAWQIENEYGNTKHSDPVYLEALKNIMETNGVVELFFTSDTPSNGFGGTLPDVLATANFQEQPMIELTLLREYQPDKPLMVMEYWTGWFDHWSEKHHTRSAEQFEKVLEEILVFGASVNMYMFHGGTNWGFWNGANLKDDSTDNGGYQPDTTSYDYDAPLSEAGDYTNKYYKVKALIEKYNKVRTKTPDLPELSKRVAFPSVQVVDYLSLNDLVDKTPNHLEMVKPIAMELLDINGNSGQSYGYIIYRKTNLNIKKDTILTIEGRVCDTVMVLVNGVLKSKITQKLSDLNEFGYWRLKNSTLTIEEEYSNATLDLVVENWGRVNYGKLEQFNQYKGLWQGDILLDNDILTDWQVIPLEFRDDWINSLDGWKKFEENQTGPSLYRAFLDVQTVADTYIDVRKWKKGTIFVNGFVLSRYFHLGPQQTAYLPGPLLKEGRNEILFFEHFVGDDKIEFLTDPVFETKS